jgi:hypothetical protein
MSLEGRSVNHLTNPLNRTFEKEKVESDFFVKATMSILSTNDQVAEEHRNTKTLASMLIDFAFRNPNMIRIINKDLKFDITTKKNRHNTTEEESRDMKNFLITGVMGITTKIVNHEDDILIPDKIRTSIIEKFKKLSMSLKEFERHLEERFSTSRIEKPKVMRYQMSR